MNEICKGNPNPRLNTKTKLGRAMKLTSIPLFVFTTGVYASVHSPNMRIKKRHHDYRETINRIHPATKHPSDHRNRD